MGMLNDVSQSDNNNIVNKGPVTRAQAKKIRDDVKFFSIELKLWIFGEFHLRIQGNSVS